MEQASAPREATVPQSPAVMVDKIMETTAQEDSVEISCTTTTLELAKHSVLILKQLYLPWMMLS